MGQFVTLTEFKFTSLYGKVWAFFMMQFAHQPIQKQAKGQLFYKLFGSGKSNFNPFPDWSTYALLQVWDSEQEALDFRESSIFKRYLKESSSLSLVEMQPIQSRGKWNGTNPFVIEKSTTQLDPDQKMAVITRASIKPSKMVRFWKAVPASQKPLQEAKDLIYTKGYGEVPFFEMATFSIWDSAEGLNNFAYRSREHVKVIKQTRQIDWYKEELFARFKVSKILEF